MLLTRLFLLLFILLTGKKNIAKPSEKMRKTKTSRMFGARAEKHSRFSTTRNPPRHAPSIAFPPLECFSSTSLHLGPTHELGWQRDQLSLSGVGDGWMVISADVLREDEIELPCYIGIRDFFSLANF